MKPDSALRAWGRRSGDGDLELAKVAVGLSGRRLQPIRLVACGSNTCR